VESLATPASVVRAQARASEVLNMVFLYMAPALKTIEPAGAAGSILSF